MENCEKFEFPEYRKKEILDIYDVSKKKLGETLNARKINFLKIVKAYYPFFVECDYKNAYDCIYTHEKNLQTQKRAKVLNEEYGLQLIKLFGKIDGDGNGQIDIHEFSKYFGKSLDTDVYNCFKNADKDGNGVLDLKEFLEFVSKNPRTLECFKKTVDRAQMDLEEERRKYLSSIFKILPIDESGNPRRPSLCDIRYDKII